MPWVIPAAAAVTAIVGVGSAVYAADQQRRGYNTQADYILNQAQYDLDMLGITQRRLDLDYQFALDKNAYESYINGLSMARYGLLLEYIGAMEGFAGQKFALETALADWQLATLDWEAGFKEQQARLIVERGALAREIFGENTAKLLAQERARRAAAGVDVGSGSPVAVLGQMEFERQREEDIMEWETDISAWEKRHEAAALLNEKNRVLLGKQGNLLAYNEQLAGLGYQRAGVQLDIQGAQATAGLLATQRSRIATSHAIDLDEIRLRRAGIGLNVQQAGWYGSAARAAATGGYLGAGASIANSFGQYYGYATQGNRMTNVQRGIAAG